MSNFESMEELLLVSLNEPVLSNQVNEDLQSSYVDDLIPMLDLLAETMENNHIANQQPGQLTPVNQPERSCISTPDDTHNQPVYSPISSASSRGSPTERIKPTRVRTQYSPWQLIELEKHFQDTQYLDRTQRVLLAQSLNMSEKQIKIWFQNRRMKLKKATKGLTKNVPLSPAGNNNDLKFGYPTVSAQNLNNVSVDVPRLPQIIYTTFTASASQGIPASQWYGFQQPPTYNDFYATGYLNGKTITHNGIKDLNTRTNMLLQHCGENRVSMFMSIPESIPELS